jgi:hypothetical protein
MRGLFLLLLAMGCRTNQETQPVASQRDRDSLLGASKLPGAAGVRGALRAADSAATRGARVDSVER